MQGLLRHLRAAGHAVVLAADPGGPLWSAVEDTGAERWPLPVRHGADVWAGVRLRRRVRDMDVIHFHTARAHALAPWLGSARGVRVVTRRMDYRPHPAAYARFLYNRCVDHVVAISRAIRDVLVATGVAPERISIIPSGVDVGRFVIPDAERDAVRREWGVTMPGQPVVLAIGALVRRKGHDVLIEAVRRLRAGGTQVTMVVCGEGPERAALAAGARAAGVADAVRFVGWRSDVPRQLGGADVVALPSTHEGLGVAALEAMAAGRAVVASDVGGLTEVVRHGETGWLVPPGDAGALERSLAQAIADPERRRAFGRAARERVMREFSMTRMAAENEALYRRLLDAGARWNAAAGGAAVGAIR